MVRLIYELVAILIATIAATTAGASADGPRGIPPSGPVWWQSYAEHTPLDVWRAGDEVRVCIYGPSYLSAAWAEWIRAMGDDAPRYRYTCERPYDLLITVTSPYLDCSASYLRSCSLPGIAQATTYATALHEIGHAMFGLAHIRVAPRCEGSLPIMADVGCPEVMAIKGYEIAYARLVRDGRYPAWWEIADDGSWRRW